MLFGSNFNKCIDRSEEVMGRGGSVDRRMSSVGLELVMQVTVLTVLTLSVGYGGLWLWRACWFKDHDTKDGEMLKPRYAECQRTML